MKKDIVIFGTGRFFQNYMDCYGNDKDKCPVFAVDNANDKVGQVIRGIEIK